MGVMTVATGGANPPPDLGREVDAVMRAARALVGVAARSIAEVQQPLTVPQLRVLVMVGTRGPVSLRAVAGELDVHPSNATRTCDRLVRAALLSRTEDEADRRLVQLTLTESGRELVEAMMGRRRAGIEHVLLAMPASRRRGLAAALEAFASAAGEPAGENSWLLGWMH